MALPMRLRQYFVRNFICPRTSVSGRAGRVGRSGSRNSPRPVDDASCVAKEKTK